MEFQILNFSYERKLGLEVHRKWDGFSAGPPPPSVSYQLPLFGRQRWRLQRLVDRVGAAEGVVEAVHLLEALVALLVDALALRHLVEDGRLRLRVVLHELHVLLDCRGRRWWRRTDEVMRH